MQVGCHMTWLEHARMKDCAPVSAVQQMQPVLPLVQDEAPAPDPEAHKHEAKSQRQVLSVVELAPDSTGSWQMQASKYTDMVFAVCIALTARASWHHAACLYPA